MSNTDNNWQDKVRRRTHSLARWTFAWLVTMALAVFGSEWLWAANKPLTVAAIVLNVLIGIGMIVANRNHLQALDELQQKIHLEAMAVTLGVGLIFGLAYSTLDVTNVIGFDAEISHMVMLMGLTYLASVLLAGRRYQ